VVLLVSNGLRGETLTKGVGVLRRAVRDPNTNHNHNPAPTQIPIPISTQILTPAPWAQPLPLPLSHPPLAWLCCDEQ